MIATRNRLSRYAAAVMAAVVVAILAGCDAAPAHPTAAGTPTMSPRPSRPVRAVDGWSAVAGSHALIHQLIRAPWGALYAGTTQGVYASADDGAAWRSLGQGFPGPGIEAWGVAAIVGRGGDAVLATCGDGAVYRLPRAGGRWTRSTTHIGSLGAYAILALPGGAVLAGSDEGIFRSADGGRSWRQTARLAVGGAVAAFARDPSDGPGGAGGTIYAGLAGLPDSLRASSDGGRSWRLPAQPLPPPSVEALLATPEHVYAGVMGARQPIWSGGSRGFTSLARGLPPDVHGMALAATGATNGLLFMGSMGTGVYMSAYASPSATRVYGPWTRLGQGPGDGVVTALLTLPGPRPVLLAGTGEGIYRLRLP